MKKFSLIELSRESANYGGEGCLTFPIHDMNWLLYVDVIPVCITMHQRLRLCFLHFSTERLVESSSELSLPQNW